MRSNWTILPLLGILMLAPWQQACASLAPAKQQVTLALKASEVALGAASDIEHGLCAPLAPKTAPIYACDGFIAGKIGLTSQVHQDLAKAFAVAFEAHETSAKVLRQVKPGSVIPSDVYTYRAAIVQAKGIAQALLTAPEQKELLTKLSLALDQANLVISILNGGK